MTAGGVIVLALAAFLLGLTTGYIAWGRYVHELEEDLDRLERLLDDDQRR